MKLRDKKTGPEPLLPLFKAVAGQQPGDALPLQAHASDRSFWRLATPGFSAVGVYTPDLAEARAFAYLTRHFRARNLAVPQIFAVSADQHYMLLEDLGDGTLWTQIEAMHKNAGSFDPALAHLYKNALSELLKFQVSAARGLDFSRCHPRSDFDSDSMLWDMRFFRREFLDRLGILYSESDLERDFSAFAAHLSGAMNDFFVYRDFQSRNIMVHNGKLFFIDYQAGRRGLLQYDVASLLYQSRAALPKALRGRLLEHYLGELEALHPAASRDFQQYFGGCVFLRLMQVLGTYGVQGLVQRKEYFEQAIPAALIVLEDVLAEHGLPLALPELQRVLTVVSRGEFAGLNK